MSQKRATRKSGKNSGVRSKRTSEPRPRILADAIARTLPRNSIRRVAVVFVLVLACLLPLTMFSGDWSAWGPLTRSTAGLSGNCARLLGVDATVEGNLIWLPSRLLAVDPQCTAVTLLAVYIALVVAYPVSWAMRFRAVLFGVPALFIANVVRLVGVAWASETLEARTFYIVHDYLFEFGMVFVVLMMWAGWLSYARRAA